MLYWFYFEWFWVDTAKSGWNIYTTSSALQQNAKKLEGGGACIMFSDFPLVPPKGDQMSIAFWLVWQSKFKLTLNDEVNGSA